MLDKILGIFASPIVNLIDELHTSPEEKLALKAQLMAIESKVVSEVIAHETARLEAQARVVVAEASSDSWLTSSWRPLTMLVFVSLIVANWFGYGPDPMPTELWVTIDIGLGGYVGGRTLEKVVPAVVAAMKTGEAI